MKKITLSIFFTLAIVANLFGQVEIAPKQIADDLYVVSGMGGNIAFLVTTEGVIVVDSGNLPRDGERIVSMVAEKTSLPIKYLIYTHCHGDHVGGAAGFPESITIIAHKDIVNNLRNFNEVSIKNNIEKTYPDRIAKLNTDINALIATDTLEILRLKEQLNRTISNFTEYKRIKIRYPNITFDGGYTLTLGNHKVELQFLGAGHTNDNIVVVFKNYNIIHAADLLFNGMVPYLFTAHGGTPKGWLKVVEGLSAKDFKVVIPGHGEVGDMSIIDNQVKYFSSLTTDVKRMKDEGKSLEEVKASLNATMYSLKGNEPQFPINVEAVFNEL
jgi:glyoxylase-like metal-dependent hydrolase (beta-lactamase superfamily II)